MKGNEKFQAFFEQKLVDNWLLPQHTHNKQKRKRIYLVREKCKEIVRI